MSIGDILSGVGSLATVAGSVTGYTPLTVGGVALGTVGSLLDSGDKKVVQETKYTDPTTPYKVKLPSGAVITMYAHGKGNSTTTTTTDDGTSAWDAVATGANTYAKLSQDEKDRKEKAKTSGTQATATDVGIADSNFLTPMTRTDYVTK